MRVKEFSLLNTFAFLGEVVHCCAWVLVHVSVFLPHCWPLFDLLLLLIQTAICECWSRSFSAPFLLLDAQSKALVPNKVNAEGKIYFRQWESPSVETCRESLVHGICVLWAFAGAADCDGLMLRSPAQKSFAHYLVGVDA